jgi:hypothetical protein
MRRSPILIAAALIAATAHVAAQEPETRPRFAVVDEGPASRRIEIRVGADLVLRSPAEGLWSVALGFEADRPTDWRHASPRTVETRGPWTILHGALDLPGGTLRLRDSYREDGATYRGVRRFEWTGNARLDPCTLTVRFEVPGAAGARPFLPGISTFGNPSGAKHGARVAIQTGAPGEESFYEEHRYPMPFACLERDAGVAALHTIPSLAPGGRRPDLWWSLGVVSGTVDAELALRSGPVASNGRFGVVKALQAGFVPYPDAVSSLAPGAVVEKEFVLEAAGVKKRATGFVGCVDTAIRLHQPFSAAGLPKYDDILRAKLAFALSRWRDTAGVPGFEMYPDHVAGTKYVMGWCGQAEALGYAFQEMDGWFGHRGLADKAERALALLATSPVDDAGFRLEFDAEKRAWSGSDPVSQGQALESFTRAIDAGRRRKADVAEWEAFVVRACDVHAARIAKPDWRPQSTAEAFFVSPLFRAARLFKRDDYAAAAMKAARHYADRHAGFDEPYWGGTLDATCEDKEGAWAALQAFLAVEEYQPKPWTQADDWPARVRHALAQVLAYTCVWDIDLPPGRLRDRGFKTRGWTVVSAQNQHLDVFGVYYAPEIWRLGRRLGRTDLTRLAAVMFRSCGQLLDAYGSQGEQIQQTNFAQAGDMSDVSRLRGGYAEGWTVFWITTHFLHAAARFAELGVDFERE